MVIDVNCVLGLVLISNEQMMSGGLKWTGKNVLLLLLFNLKASV
jgi:hypothetical protein